MQVIYDNQNALNRKLQANDWFAEYLDNGKRNILLQNPRYASDTIVCGATNVNTAHVSAVSLYEKMVEDHEKEYGPHSKDVEIDEMLKEWKLSK